MTDTATIEALEAAIARAEDECPNAPYVPVKIELAKQAASTIRALSAENERMRGLTDELHLELQIARKSYAIGSLTPEQKEVFG